MISEYKSHNYAVGIILVSMFVSFTHVIILTSDCETSYFNYELTCLSPLSYACICVKSAKQLAGNVNSIAHTFSTKIIIIVKKVWCNKG